MRKAALRIKSKVLYTLSSGHPGLPECLNNLSHPFSNPDPLNLFFALLPVLFTCCHLIWILIQLLPLQRCLLWPSAILSPVTYLVIFRLIALFASWHKLLLEVRHVCVCVFPRRILTLWELMALSVLTVAITSMPNSKHSMNATMNKLRGPHESQVLSPIIRRSSRIVSFLRRIHVSTLKYYSYFCFEYLLIYTI